ncbi:hypothetical protein C7212DRAFT_343031 [Tuber magnatum]|uniref:Uncharacterized protein n=1 Tax=Tuber magnatum TaxID=42249 RepID=A0A317SSA9_9PEZI|nr:hypothetical protein C7212DRAFT_343031 [Tuber magnatum]
MVIVTRHEPSCPYQPLLPLCLLGLCEVASLDGIDIVLHDAWGETGTITRLIEWGLGVNAVNHSGMKLLHWTAIPDATAPDITWDWRFSIAELLLVHQDIEVNLVDRKGRTALHLAAVYGARRLSKRLLKHPDITLSISDGWCNTIAAGNHGPECGDGKGPTHVSPGLCEYTMGLPGTAWDGWDGRIPPLHRAIALAGDKLVNMLLAHPGLDIEMRTQASVILRLANEDLVLPEYCSAIRLARLVDHAHIERSIQHGAPLPVISMVYTAHTHFHPLDLRSRDPLGGPAPNARAPMF